MIKVLLIGPLDPEVPQGDLKLLTGGETTYVRTLVNDPPEGVFYVHWSDALRKGGIEFTPWHYFVSILVKLRILPISSGSFCIRVKGNFDLVHAHSNSLKIDITSIPVILSDSSSNYLFLRDYLDWPEWRIGLGFKLRRWLFNRLGVIDADTNLEKAKKLIVFSEFAKKIHLKLQASKGKLEVIYPGLPRPDFRNKGNRGNKGDKGNRIEKGKKRDKVSILFVGVWFERKGGHLVLEAFERVSKEYPNVRLTIVGEVPKKYKSLYSSSPSTDAQDFDGELSRTDKLESGSKKGSSRLHSNNIYQYDYVPRERLMREFFPKADIFVLVPPKVEGFGFVVLEAMSFGIPVVVSDVCALPELVQDGKTGFVVRAGSVGELVDRVEVLIKDQSLRKKMGEAARKRFQENFSIEKSNKMLLKIYHEALS